MELFSVSTGSWDNSSLKTVSSGLLYGGGDTVKRVKTVRSSHRVSCAQHILIKSMPTCLVSQAFLAKVFLTHHLLCSAAVVVVDDASTLYNFVDSALHQHLRTENHWSR